MDQTPHLKQIPNSDEIQGGKELQNGLDQYYVLRILKELHVSGALTDLTPEQQEAMSRGYVLALCTRKYIDEERGQ